MPDCSNFAPSLYQRIERGGTTWLSAGRVNATTGKATCSVYQGGPDEPAALIFVTWSGDGVYSDGSVSNFFISQ